MRIAVTDKHLGNAKRGSTTEGPISLAVKDMFDIRHCSVVNGVMRITSDEIQLPPNAVENQILFDAGVGQPFEFTITPIPWSLCPFDEREKEQFSLKPWTWNQMTEEQQLGFVKVAHDAAWRKYRVLGKLLQ